MERKEKYDEVKEKLITDISINKDNRKLFKEFFEFEEYKLKRKNNIPVLDNACYKTLYGYLIYLRNANKWFKNKAWKDLTKEDIKKVYDDLEEGRIKNAKGLIYKDRKSYYNKIFKSKPFAMAGKLQLAQEVIEYFGEAKEEVKFIELDTFKKLVNVAIKPEHKFLMWLAWDIGENINSLLLLKKNDFYKEINPD
ncbi:MAG: hypothetical protein NT076_04365, partial [Candidatus Pacearchaeota archaeon]|nr:hypothetical protein [Candidatus Pacearchaeota archaeon]